MIKQSELAHRIDMSFAQAMENSDGPHFENDIRRKQ